MENILLPKLSIFIEGFWKSTQAHSQPKFKNSNPCHKKSSKNAMPLGK
jgi:hypothetical protein